MKPGDKKAKENWRKNKRKIWTWKWTNNIFKKIYANKKKLNLKNASKNIYTEIRTDYQGTRQTLLKNKE